MPILVLTRTLSLFNRKWGEVKKLFTSYATSPKKKKVSDRPKHNTSLCNGYGL